MEALDLPYVVATGEVTVSLNKRKPHSINSINQLIDDLAARLPEQVAVGMPAPGDHASSWICQSLTYGDLHKASNALARRLHDEDLVAARTKEQGSSQRIIAMLASSSLDFLIHWLALLRLGYGALLIAPQSSPEAVVNLLSSTKAISMLYDDRTADLAKESASKCDIRLIPMKVSAFDISLLPKEVEAMPRALSYEQESDTLAIIFHTSGSTGMPKPIYQRHAVWTRALPRKPGPAGFTTTPLYHGGAADLLRAMMSESILYLYTPSRPITAANVLASLRACEDAKYFLAVPYVLKMLAENEETRDLLSGMEMISVGGAPLPEEIGNELVRRYGWKLVSRMGSSECGFLMSSWRDFENDKAWSYLRDVGQEKMLQFESQADDLAELVVDKDWPSLNTSNRPDGRYATVDLYEKHPSIPHAWRYFGRADDLLVLLNGEKVSPAPMEQIWKSDARISECLIYGQNRPSICCLLFPSPNYRDMDRDQLLQELMETMQKANGAAPTFGQISAEMIAFVSDASELPKTSKGTVQKKKAEQCYSSIIEELYSPTKTTSTTSRAKMSKDQLLDHLRAIVLSSSQTKEEVLKSDSDFFAIGVNSLQASRIRSQIKSSVSLNDQDLASNVVFEYPSLDSLTAHVFSLQENESTKARQPDVLDTMRQMADRNSNLLKKSSSPRASGKRTKVSGNVVLTGATGALGVHLLHQLLQLPDVLQVYCLCRAQDDADASARISKSLLQRGLRSDDMLRVTCLASDLSRDDLGLSQKAYSDLSEIDVVIHCAWAVNFSWTLRSFESGQIRGLGHLINLSMQSKQSSPLLLFCSSIASVLNPSRNGPAIESPSDNPVDSAQMGYAQSKWVAEQLCSEASRKGLDVIVYRLGQLCGDTKKGIWNETEGWPLLIKSAEVTGVLPRIDDHPSWLPVDIAASSMFDLVAQDRPDAAFYHIYNSDTSTDWQSILQYLRAAGLDFSNAEPKEWLSRLEAIDKSAEEVPSLGLLDLWKSAYGSDKASAGPEVSIDKAMQSASLRGAGPITQELVQKFVTAWRSTGFLG